MEGGHQKEEALQVEVVEQDSQVKEVEAAVEGGLASQVLGEGVEAQTVVLVHCGQRIETRVQLQTLAGRRKDKRDLHIKYTQKSEKPFLKKINK